ncbi:peptidyl-prolyl cis-trans isomerase-like 4 [Argiope bruennichi]|uniref:peptidyl-prolyl cis-trans isomerase-like 4 n=1 Tax=Argiope bruennichi TaxID=94029 RepID=UPI0024948813|nr:peptidyl-prolyl cis-trans isomerase-like 4 [Argiope bruennichi]
MSVVIETTLGDITVDLFLKERPNTCLNFLKLCKVKYYNFCVFYKVERNFIAQTGDPTCTGRGGESIFSRIYGDQATYFEAELKPRLKHEKLGTLSMVNNGNNMNGSQFFITLGENLTYLDEVHTVFGEVAEGFETLLKINEAICDPNNRPYQDILITHTVILHDPYDDPLDLEIPDASPLPTKEQLESNYIRADEEIDDTKGKSAEEIEEKIKESEAKARATILEMVGDIPDVDVKPPENVLFVCKLNPVTTSEDLEIIFSRFGPIKSCEVIKDKKTGESLQYAFIEFEKEEDCENAYFKMDNVLIDDRRIHVDFSQSVSKMMFEQGNKFSKNKNSKETLVIKNKEKKSDGYDMIFDMDDEISHSKHKKKDKRSPDRKYKRQDSPSKRSTERRRERSNSVDRRYGEHVKNSRTYYDREYDRSKSSRDSTHRMSKDSRKEFTKSSSPSESYKSTSFSRKKQGEHTSKDHYSSSDESGTIKPKMNTNRYRSHRHDSSSSGRSISPQRKQKSSTDKISSSKHSHSTEKFYEKKSQKQELLSSYRNKERKNVSSRHKSNSSESDVPRQPIKRYSRSPEISDRRLNKSKDTSGRSRSHQRLKKQPSKKPSSSPESYNSRLKSRRHYSRSPDSLSPERKKRSYRSQSRSLSPKKYDDPKIKNSYTLHEKSSKHSKKSKKNKKRTKSSCSSSNSDSDTNSKIKYKDSYSSHSRTHKTSRKEYKHRK